MGAIGAKTAVTAKHHTKRARPFQKHKRARRKITAVASTKNQAINTRLIQDYQSLFNFNTA
ncbi:MAG: hypothetical protein GWP17_01165 [Aquificales bacterium]|nr:hypothetical protein [Aquificales bacterium]